MDSRNREQLLAASGLQSWLPRSEFGARVRGRTAKRVQPLDPVAVAESQSSARENLARLRDSLQPGSHTRKPRAKPSQSPNRTVAVQTSQTSQTSQTAPTARRTAADRVSFSVLHWPAHLLILDAGAAAPDRHAMLDNIARAIISDDQFEPQIRSMHLRPEVHGSIADVLRGLFDRHTVDGEIKRVIVMGDRLASEIFSEQLGFGQRKDSRYTGADVQIVYTHSTAEMLAQPALKAESWRQHLQAVRDSGTAE